MNATTAVLISLVVAFVAGVLVRRYGANAALDQPGQRSLHQAPTTRLGGVAIAFGLASGLIAQLPDSMGVGVLLALGIAGLLGFAEDVRGVPIILRLVLQVLAAVIAVVVVLAGDTPEWLMVLAGLWIVTFVNEYNFMDGIDGLAGSLLAVAGLTWLIAGLIEDVTLMQVLGAASLGCAIGFLPHNFPAAKIFMGDLGSYAAGAWLATSAVVGIKLGVHPVTVVAPLVVFVFDATWTLAVRASRGENLFVSHRSHLYQRLVLAGWSQRRTTLTVTAVSGGVAALGLLALLDGMGFAIVAMLLGTCLVAGYGIVGNRVSSRSPQTSGDSRFVSDDTERSRLS